MAKKNISTTTTKYRLPFLKEPYSRCSRNTFPSLVPSKANNKRTTIHRINDEPRIDPAKVVNTRYQNFNRVTSRRMVGKNTRHVINHTAIPRGNADKVDTPNGKIHNLYKNLSCYATVDHVNKVHGKIPCCKVAIDYVV